MASTITVERETFLGNTIQAGRAAAPVFEAEPYREELVPIIQAGLQARAELVEAFLDFGRSKAHAYDYSHVSYEDRELAAFEGLMFAADHFKPWKGRFTTIAEYWCSVTIERYIQSCYTECLDDHTCRDGEKASTLFDKPVFDDHTILDLDRVIEVMGEVLSEKEATFISMVFGLNGHRAGGNPTRVAESLNLSRQRGAQIYTTAIGKLRAALA